MFLGIYAWIQPSRGSEHSSGSILCVAKRMHLNLNKNWRLKSNLQKENIATVVAPIQDWVFALVLSKNRGETRPCIQHVCPYSGRRALNSPAVDYLSVHCDFSIHIHRAVRQLNPDWVFNCSLKNARGNTTAGDDSGRSALNSPAVPIRSLWFLDACPLRSELNQNESEGFEQAALVDPPD